MLRVQRIRPSERFFVTPFFESRTPTMERQVREFMTSDVLVTTPDATPFEVAQAMVQERIDVLPVVDRDLKLLGMVSEGDLLNQVNFPHGTILDGLRGLFGRGDHRLEKAMSRRVDELMSKDVCRIGPEEVLQQAAETMIRKHVRHLPVTDRDGKLLGLLDRRQVLRSLLEWSERGATGEGSEG